MDAFCLPSMSLKYFGNSLVEAMAMSLPSIVFSDGGGMLEHIQPDVTGFTVADVPELVTVIKRLLADSDLGRRVGKQASEFVRARYTLAKSASRPIAAFTSIPSQGINKVLIRSGLFFLGEKH